MSKNGGVITSTFNNASAPSTPETRPFPGQARVGKLLRENGQEINAGVDHAGAGFFFPRTANRSPARCAGSVTRSVGQWLPMTTPAAKVGPRVSPAFPPFAK